VELNHQIVVFDAADLSAESTFWAEVLGVTVDTEEAGTRAVRGVSVR
jgi:hypothetical protein